MAYTYDTKIHFNGTSNPLVQALTLGASANLLVLHIFNEVSPANTARAGGAPTYNGTAMTQVSGGIFNHPTGEGNMEVWYLIGPDTGSSYNISIPNSNGNTLYAAASSYVAATGVVFDTYATQTETSTNSPYVTITTEGTGELIVAAVFNDTNGLSISARTGTALYELDNGAWCEADQYLLESTSNPQTMDWTWANNGDKMSVAIAFKDETAAVIPTVTTQAVSSVTEEGAYGNGTITDTGGANASVRGFCILQGSSGDPDINDTLINESGDFGTGSFSLSLGTLLPDTDYRVRAYATNVTGTGYGTTVDLHTHAYPTVVPNTTDATDFGTDNTPTLEFTGTDNDGDDLEYEIQISSDNTFSGETMVHEYDTTGGGGIIHLQDAGDGNVDDRPGQSFYGHGGYLTRIETTLGKQGSPDVDVFLRIYNHQGTFGTSSEPLNAVDRLETPTPGWIAESSQINITGSYPDTPAWQSEYFYFTGQNRIVLSDGVPYVLIMDQIGGLNQADCAACLTSTELGDEGNFYNDGYSVNNGVDSRFDMLFRVWEEPLVDRDFVSDTDSGFVNTVNGGDTHPFTSGQKISYTVPSGSELPDGTYYWRVRVKDPSGSNTWSDWTTTRSFIIDAGMVFPSSVPSSSQVGQPTVMMDQTVSPDSVSSAEAVGSPTVIPTYIDYQINADSFLIPPAAHKSGPFADSNGNLYIVMWGYPKDTCMLKSTNGGQSWAEVDAANHPDGNAGAWGNVISQSAVQDGDVIHVTSMHEAASGMVAYHRFNTSDNSSADQWAVVDTAVFSYTDSGGEAGLSIVVQSDGDLLIISNGQNERDFTASESVVYHYSQNNGSSWTSDQGLSLTDGDNIGGFAVLGANDKIHLSWKEENGIYYRHQSLSDVTGTPTTKESLSDYTVADTPNYGMTPFVYYDDNGDEIVTMVGLDSTFYPRMTVITNDGTPASSVEVTHTVIWRSDWGTSSPHWSGHDLSGFDKNLYYVFADNATQDVWFVANEDMAGWGTPIEVVDATTADFISSNCYVRNGHNYLGIYWGEITNGETRFVAVDLGPVAVGNTNVPVSGITSQESVGEPTITTGNVNVPLTEIVSSESFGSPTTTTGNVNVPVTEISSSEVVGEPTILTGGVTVTVTEILSNETVGEPTILAGNVNISTTEILSEETIGEPTLSTGNVNVPVTEILSSETFGEPVISTGNLNISVTEILSAESVGEPVVTSGNVNVVPTEILSSELFGNLTILTGGVTLLIPEILSGETFGEPTIAVGNVDIIPTEILSSEVVNDITIVVAGANIQPDSILSGETIPDTALITIWTFSDDFTGNDYDPWSVSKWITTEGT